MNEIIKEVSEVTIEFANNGFVIKASGRTTNDDWIEEKVIATDLLAVTDAINYYSKVYKGTV